MAKTPKIQPRQARMEGGRTTVSASISPATHRRLNEYMVQKGLNRSAAIAELLAKVLKVPREMR